MGSEWQTFSLADLYDFSSGLSKPRSAFGSGYPFLSFKDVFYNSAVPSQLHELVNSTERERARGSVERGDVFLTRTSETMDELAMSSVALTDIPDATFNGFTKRLRPKHQRRVAPEFARYYFRSPTFRQHVYAMSSLSTRASLNNEMLERLVITLPSYEEQLDIGETLGALDDRIDLLRQTNTTLEAVAQALFKSWFVDFDPVHAKAEGREPEAMDAATAALFPSEFEESELGSIPKGWRARSLDSVATYLNGLALQKFPAESESEFLPVIKIAQLRAGNTTGSDRASAHLKPEYVVHDGDVLFSWSGSLEVEFWCGGDGALNQHLFKVTSDEAPKWFYYLATRIHLPEFRRVAAGKATTMGHIQRKHLAQAKVAVPPPKVLAATTKIIEPLLDRRITNSLQMRELAQLCDTLLPRLISGKLRVPDTTKPEEEAIA